MKWTCTCEYAYAQRKTSLGYLPSVIEVYAFCFFFAGSVVGPQFPFRTYKAFVSGVRCVG